MQSIENMLNKDSCLVSHVTGRRLYYMNYVEFRKLMKQQ